jgi:hypothetical protein
MTVRSALEAGGGAGYLGRGSSQGKSPSLPSIRGRRGLSLHYKTKLYSTTEADSVSTSQCKRNVVSVQERSSGKGI